MRKRIALLAVAAALSVMACEGTDNSGLPTKLAIVGGNNQTAFINQRLPDLLRVKVTNKIGDPSVGIRVRWSVNGAGTPDSVTSATDEQGIAVTGFKLGADPGDTQVQAAIPGVDVQPVVFTETAQNTSGGGGGGGGQ